ncbi:ER membrane protein complex subunit 7 [Rhineura floridana]|uniref:ER membrane protein complex subunit 7 n=1 Tax=Rhineura floridana TaxID=261503 RepID=UPI002AC88D27|nr:ER membrane protein complex subunit 7 [Rhineura floridana]
MASIRNRTLGVCDYEQRRPRFHVFVYHVTSRSSGALGLGFRCLAHAPVSKGGLFCLICCLADCSPVPQTAVVMAACLGGLLGTMLRLLLAAFFAFFFSAGSWASEVTVGAGSGETVGASERFKIEGRAVVPGVKPQDWIAAARVLVDGEEHVGFLKTDGSFVVHDVPSGSYVVEVISPAYKFEPVRVDITSKGKMRARFVNYIKTSEVVRLPYPLQMKSSGPPSYFIKRESWGWTDFLMNPMVMMMILPLLIFVLLPKVVNTSDPDMRREMEQSMNMLNSNHELPDVSEFMTRLFSSKSSSKSSSGSSKTGKSGAGKRR